MALQGFKRSDRGELLWMGRGYGRERRGSAFEAVVNRSYLLGGYIARLVGCPPIPRFVSARACPFASCVSVREEQRVPRDDDNVGGTSVRWRAGRTKPVSFSRARAHACRIPVPCFGEVFCCVLAVYLATPLLLLPCSALWLDVAVFTLRSNLLGGWGGKNKGQDFDSKRLALAFVALRD